MALCDLFWLCDNTPYALTRCILPLQPVYLQKTPTYYKQIAVLRSKSVHFPFLLFREAQLQSSFKCCQKGLDNSSLNIFIAWLFTFISSLRSVVFWTSILVNPTTPVIIFGDKSNTIAFLWLSCSHSLANERENIISKCLCLSYKCSFTHNSNNTQLRHSPFQLKELRSYLWHFYLHSNQKNQGLPGLQKVELLFRTDQSITNLKPTITVQLSFMQ